MSETEDVKEVEEIKEVKEVREVKENEHAGLGGCECLEWRSFSYPYRIASG
jgi:hypothetical protein